MVGRWVEAAVVGLLLSLLVVPAAASGSSGRHNYGTEAGERVGPEVEALQQHLCDAFGCPLRYGVRPRHH